VDPAKPGNVTWRTFDHRPRFGNNYAGLRNRIAILSEAYSYVDFKRRVEVTEDFVDEIWKSAARNAKQIMSLTAEADRQFTAPPNPRPVELGLDFEIRALPAKVGIVEMLAMTEMAVPVAMKDYGLFAATRSAAMPKGWLMPANPRLSAAIERLRWHGVRVDEITTPAHVSVQRFTIADYTRSERLFQGHREARLKGAFEPAELTVAPGTLFVPADQPLARLAFYLLEPESDDGHRERHERRTDEAERERQRRGEQDGVEARTRQREAAQRGTSRRARTRRHTASASSPSISASARSTMRCRSVTMARDFTSSGVTKSRPSIVAAVFAARSRWTPARGLAPRMRSADLRDSSTMRTT